MEKHERFRQIKAGHIPETFREEFPLLADLIIQMVHPDPNIRPDCLTALSIIQGHVDDILSRSVNNSQNVYLKFKRERSQSINLSEVQSFEVKSSSESLEINTVFVKLVDNKLLVLSSKESIKASLVYDMSESDIECQITNGIATIKIDHLYMNTYTILADLSSSSELVEKIRNNF